MSEETMSRPCNGLSVRRIVDRSRTRVPEHAHDWPMISIFVLGGYSTETELDSRCICTPSVVFYRAGAAHRNRIGEDGFEQIEIEFDPDWLGRSWLPDVPLRRWIGDCAPHACSALLEACRSDGFEPKLRDALRALLAPQRWPADGPAARPRKPPAWVDEVTRRLQQDASMRIGELARAVGRHPAWIGPAYRRARGEGLSEIAARFRVARAARLLRETDETCAAVALEAGFCDQSHMNRIFRRLLGRSPLQVREDRACFRRI